MWFSRPMGTVWGAKNKSTMRSSSLSVRYRLFFAKFLDIWMIVLNTTVFLVNQRTDWIGMNYANLVPRPLKRRGAHAPGYPRKICGIRISSCIRPSTPNRLYHPYYTSNCTYVATRHYGNATGHAREPAHARAMPFLLLNSKGPGTKLELHLHCTYNCTWLSCDNWHKINNNCSTN